LPNTSARFTLSARGSFTDFQKKEIAMKRIIIAEVIVSAIVITCFAVCRSLEIPPNATRSWMMLTAIVTLVVSGIIQTKTAKVTQAIEHRHIYNDYEDSDEDIVVKEYEYKTFPILLTCSSLAATLVLVLVGFSFIAASISDPTEFLYANPTEKLKNIILVFTLVFGMILILIWHADLAIAEKPGIDKAYFRISLSLQSLVLGLIAGFGL
jgi:hypothetical protein